MRACEEKVKGNAAMQNERDAGCNLTRRMVLSVRPVTRSQALPSLFRFLFYVAILAGIVYGGMFALATFVEPVPREMVQTVPASKFAK